MREIVHVTSTAQTLHKVVLYGRVVSHMKSHLEFAKRHVEKKKRVLRYDETKMEHFVFGTKFGGIPAHVRSEACWW